EVRVGSGRPTPGDDRRVRAEPARGPPRLWVHRRVAVQREQDRESGGGVHVASVTGRGGDTGAHGRAAVARGGRAAPPAARGRVRTARGRGRPRALPVTTTGRHG